MPRSAILATYAEWTALSAMRSKAPIKSRDDVYSLLRGDTFSQVLDASRGPITSAEFNEWHRRATAILIHRESRLTRQVGWAAKLLNVYLKTYAYVGDGGRPQIRDCLHPPIDRGLWQGINRRFQDHEDILRETCCVTAISDIATYDIYQRVINGLRRAAEQLRCSLIEVEQLWVGTQVS